MADLEKPIYVDLMAAARSTISAHDAVVAEIATHAEKERASRQAANHKREQDLKLTGGLNAAITQL